MVSLQASQHVDQKRVRNAKVKWDFEMQLEFPTYREGLNAIHSGSMLPFR